MASYIANSIARIFWSQIQVDRPCRREYAHAQAGNQPLSLHIAHRPYCCRYHMVLFGGIPASRDSFGELDFCCTRNWSGHAFLPWNPIDDSPIDFRRITEISAFISPDYILLLEKLILVGVLLYILAPWSLFPLWLTELCLPVVRDGLMFPRSIKYLSILRLAETHLQVCTRTSRMIPVTWSDGNFSTRYTNVGQHYRNAGTPFPDLLALKYHLSKLLQVSSGRENWPIVCTSYHRMIQNGHLDPRLGGPTRI